MSDKWSIILQVEYAQTVCVSVEDDIYHALLVASTLAIRQEGRVWVFRNHAGMSVWSSDGSFREWVDVIQPEENILRNSHEYESNKMMGISSLLALAMGPYSTTERRPLLGRRIAAPPASENPWQMGHAARLLKKETVNACPFSDGSFDAKQWRRGWNEANQALVQFSKKAKK